MHSVSAGSSCGYMRVRSHAWPLASARRQRAGTAHESQAAAAAIMFGCCSAIPSRWPGLLNAINTVCMESCCLGSCKHRGAAGLQWKAAAASKDVDRWQAQSCTVTIVPWRHRCASGRAPAGLHCGLACDESTAAAPDEGGVAHRSNPFEGVVQSDEGCSRYRNVWTVRQVQQALKLLRQVPHIFSRTPAGRYVSVCCRCQSRSSSPKVHSCAESASLSTFVCAWPRVPLASRGLHAAAQRARCPASPRPGPGK